MSSPTLPHALHNCSRQLAQRLHNLDTLWTTSTANAEMANNGAMYLVILTTIMQGHIPPTDLLTKIMHGTSMEALTFTSDLRVAITWRDCLSVLTKHSPRTLFCLVAHIDENEAIGDATLAQAVDWVLGLVRAGTHRNQAPNNHPSTDSIAV